MKLDLKMKTKLGHPTIISFEGGIATKALEMLKSRGVLIELKKKEDSTEVIAIYGLTETLNWSARKDMEITLWKDESYLVLRY